jgi:hypothetical protein
MSGGPSDDHLSDRVHQATAMISAQAGCDEAEALAMLIVKAAEIDQNLDDTALDVLDGIIRFDP